MQSGISLKDETFHRLHISFKFFFIKICLVDQLDAAWFESDFSVLLTMEKGPFLLAKFGWNVTLCLLIQNIYQTSFQTLYCICFQHLFLSQNPSHSSTLLSSVQLLWIFFQLYKAVDRKVSVSKLSRIKTVMLCLFFSILMILPFMKGNHFMFLCSSDSFNICDNNVGGRRVG